MSELVGRKSASWALGISQMLPAKPVKRLARFAETHFASLCAMAGALCNESQEDENGWDYLVEFPPDVTSGHADTHPPAKRAFVQVKSTRGNQLSCAIMLRESWVVADASDAQIKTMEDDYQRRLSELEKDCKVLGLNDIAVFVRSL